MKFNSTNIPGLTIVENFQFSDSRGEFVKLFSADIYEMHGVSFEPREIYYSVSKKNVIRGMHFQRPPHDHAKLVTVLVGAIIDVVLDIRILSPSYGKYFFMELKEGMHSIYIPKGCVHGFKSLKENSIVLYCQTSCYSKEHDTGVLWNSFGFDWGITDPIISDRDNSFEPFDKLFSPFKS
jgi:dTDP-4-dehydrorhamnose 3,5-epimerase